ncbi:anhydro-N-acetylmuramic acid kinase [Georgenia muralis]|uniref:Anhydro-N-acetylmuramic acid kinase n=1 Tax=Georgenia muralis TaxID=154117 RepID=A0A3N5A7R0_9MICO|nr:anhydro-N-acetylmuramic acid kinase [Georgenia muralis]RPF27731.1 anhydro-N-acetylmuramic acid kinase [Georgenia muralis]
MRVLALSSGTSVDAIDVALADLTDAEGTLIMRPLGHAEVPWPEELRKRIVAALPPALPGAGEWCALDTLVGQAFGDAAAAASESLGPAELVVSHGQTLFHWVRDGRARGTLQVGAPAWIHARCGLPVVHDLRTADIAAGGHGAPLVSLLDQLWLGGTATAALNVGGIANVTLLGGADVVTGDTGPGNCLIDAAARAFDGRPYDAGGELAATGTVDRRALDLLLTDPFYAQPLPRSTGREHFHAGYVAERLAALPDSPTGPDLLATLTELTARTIAAQVRGVARVVVSGGGAHNRVLMSRLRELLPGVVTATSLGLDGDAKEAYLFAVLGYLAVRGLPGTAPRRLDRPDGPRCTGAARPVVLGSLTPPAPAPCEPATVPVSRLQILEEQP